MATEVCKPSGRATWSSRICRVCLCVCGGILVGTQGACQSASTPRTVTVETLEAAPVAATSHRSRVVVPEAEQLRAMCMPLGPRMGLLQIRTKDQYRQLAQLCPHIGPCPDLHRGVVVGLACWAGMPLDGGWPVHLDSVKIHCGGGLVKATFATGSYLPDGTAYLATAYVPGLHDVLVVAVNETSFYPE